MKHHSWLAGVIALVFGCAAPVAAEQPSPAGRVKIVSGTAHIVRGGILIRAEPGLVVYEADAVRTGADGSIGVTLKDDTRFSLGPSSEARLDRFVCNTK